MTACLGNEIATVLPLGVRNGSAPDAFNLRNGMPPAVAVAEGCIQPLNGLIPDLDAWKAGFPAGSFAQLYEEPTPNLANVVQGPYTGQITGVTKGLSKPKGAMNAPLDKAIADANAQGANVRREDLVNSDWNPSVDYVS